MKVRSWLGDSDSDASAAKLESGGHSGPLRAILAAPDEVLSSALIARLAEVPDLEVEVAARLENYPETGDLTAIVDAVQPEIAIIDVASDLDAACGLIRSMAAAYPQIHSIAVHHANDPSTLMQCLRMGATEFLHAPFVTGEMRAAVSRIRRLWRGPTSSRRTGKVLGFTSAKPGSGSSTIAQHMALALRHATGERVLLADFDLLGGTLGRVCKVRRGSLVDALRDEVYRDGAGWSSVTYFVNRIEVLQAPENPHTEPVDLAKLEPLLSSARATFDWVILDLPTIFRPLSLSALANCDRGFLVSTSELPNLHLARRAVEMLRRCDFPPNRVEVLLNRQPRTAPVDERVVAELVGCRVCATLPNDYLALHPLGRLERLPPGNRLGAALDELARKFSAGREEERALACGRAVPLASVA